MQRTIGGDRLGSGKKMKVDLKSYERSSHNLGYVWRSTMASGTLVPFMAEVGLPGDTFDIDLNADIKTHPTVGPLFGSYKVQMDVFMCPIRLYQGQLHNNKLGIGMNMANIKLPQVRLKADVINAQTVDIDNSQINPSSIFSYLNIRGLGRQGMFPLQPDVEREFNALSYISYWDIYKNYYANKQEEIGAVIHNDNLIVEDVQNVYSIINGISAPIQAGIGTGLGYTFNINDEILFNANSVKETDDFILYTKLPWEINMQTSLLSDLPFNWTWNGINLVGVCYQNNYSTDIYGWNYNTNGAINNEPKIKTFLLSNIDDMREALQSWISPAPYIINEESMMPYNLPLERYGSNWSKMNSQEGLGIKTYQSDLFNNWMSTEWIVGNNGINAITAIDTSDGSFTIDTLNLSKKVYDMLNRIAISGGTYDDWLDTVYTHERMKRVETPVYMGGLSKELVFQEVVSNSQSEDSPLGSLAGRGVMSGKHKGGKVTVKVDEPCYIIGIASLTPRVDYSQGNKWDTNLKTMDDFHKPALDEIGFQDLVTDQMAFWDTINTDAGTQIFQSAGKQPAWLNYMTNVNQTRGNFAINDNEMFMTLNRRYEYGNDGGPVMGAIKDLTTYIDPVKFNYIFADTARDAQNFWTQIGVDITARRKMSAKIMPNL
jgi:hypothetical protein